jgi:hypothetical protein
MDPVIVRQDIKENQVALTIDEISTVEPADPVEPAAYNEDACALLTPVTDDDTPGPPMTTRDRRNEYMREYMRKRYNDNKEMMTAKRKAKANSDANVAARAKRTISKIQSVEALREVVGECFTMLKGKMPVTVSAPSVECSNT